MLDRGTEQQIAHLSVGSHVGLVYQDPTDPLPTVGAFFRAGLGLGERCVYVADDEAVKQLRSALPALGVDGTVECARGALQLIAAQEWLFSETGEPRGMIDGLRRRIDDALADGFAGIRVAIEMTEALAITNDPKRLRAYAVAVNTLVPRSRSRCIFLYRQTSLTPACLREVLHAHPLVALDGRLYPNIYYEPPDAALDEVSQGYRVNAMIDQIRQTSAAAEQLRQRQDHQAVISELILDALGNADFSRISQKAATVLATSLGNEFAKVLELLPDGTRLLLRAGVGWREGLVGHATVDAGIDSQAGYTLLSNHPVIVDDLSTELRFRGSPLLVEHGVISGMSTIIQGRDRPWGVLGTHTTARRRFTDDDVRFLQAIADVLALALDRGQLAAARARLIATVETSLDAIVGTTLDGVITTWNTSAERLLSYTADEVLGHPLSILIPASRQEEFGRMVTRIKPGEQVQDDQAALLRRDGEIIPVTLAISSLSEDTGVTAGLVLIAHDRTGYHQLKAEWEQLLAREQTSRTRAEIAHVLWKGEWRFRQLVENIQDYAIFIVDAQGRVASWNTGAQRILGYRPEEILGKHVSIFHLPEEIRSGKSEERLRTAARQGRYEDTGWRVRQDGSRFWANVVVTALHDRDGLIIGFASITCDLTERRRAEAEITALKDALAEQLAGMTDLYRLVVRLTTHRTLKSVFDEILGAVTALQHTDRSALLLYDPNQDRLYPVASTGLDEAFLDRLDVLSPEADVSRRAVKERRGIIVTDLEEDLVDTASVVVGRHGGYRAVFSTPLITQRGDVIGALASYFRDPHQPTEREVSLIDLYARFAAGFIENVRLVEAARDAARQPDAFPGSIRSARPQDALGGQNVDGATSARLRKRLSSVSSGEARDWNEAGVACFLATVPIFQELLPEALHHVAKIALIRQVQRGQFVFLEGEPVNALRVVVEGQIKILRETEDGREVILRLVNPREPFSIMGNGTEPVERSSAQAHEDATILEIPTAEFVRLLSGSPSGTRATLEAFAALLQDAEARICDLQTQGAERRLARVLIQLAPRSTVQLNDQSHVSLELTRQELADLAGTNLSTASRTISAWVKAGIIAAGRAWIIILDHPSLRTIAMNAE